MNNYLDDYTDPLTGETYGKGDDKEIIKRIIETYQNCRIYGILHNNCEHIATYVRYGVRVAVQVCGSFSLNLRTGYCLEMQKENNASDLS